MHRGAQPPSEPHGGQAGAGYLALEKPGAAGPRGEPPGDNHLLPVSKLEPTAFYAVATAVYERALGGPCLVGSMRGISL